MPLSQAAKAPIHSAQSFFNLVFGFVRKIAEEIYARLTFQFIYCDGVIGKVVICFPFILLLCPESYGTVSHAVFEQTCHEEIPWNDELSLYSPDDVAFLVYRASLADVERVGRCGGRPASYLSSILTQRPSPLSFPDEL